MWTDDVLITTQATDRLLSFLLRGVSFRLSPLRSVRRKNAPTSLSYLGGNGPVDGLPDELSFRHQTCKLG